MIPKDPTGTNSHSDFAALAAGLGHSLGLKAGMVMAWGRNDYGQCDTSPNTDFATVAAGAYHSLGLRADGSIVAWGLNREGQCDVRRTRASRRSRGASTTASA